MTRMVALKLFAGVEGASLKANPRVDCEDGGAVKLQVRGVVTDETGETFASLVAASGATGSLSDATPKAARGVSHTIELPKGNEAGMAFLELWNGAGVTVAE